MKSAFSPFYEERRPVEHLYRVGDFSIVRCRDSGLVYLGNPLSDRDLETFYDVGYFEGDAARKGYASYARDESVLRENFRRRLEDLVSRLSNPGRLSLLDYGCAYGYFLDEARNSFGSVTGAEINEDVAAIARERYGLKVRSGRDVMEAFLPNSYDLITMWDVIEHLSRPRTALLQAARVLRPGGELHITTGDIGSLVARLLGRRWRLMNPPQHISYFSESLIRGLLSETGFDTVEVRRIGKLVSLRFVLFILSYLVRRDFNLKGRASRLASLHFYINLFDVMYVRARKRTSDVHSNIADSATANAPSENS